jgi:hypothetical protein
MAKDAIEHATVIYAPNAARLVRQHRFDGGPFIIAEFVAYDSRLRFRSLNHVSGSAINPQRPVAMSLMLLIYFRFRQHSGRDRTRCWLDPVANDPKLPNQHVRFCMMSLQRFHHRSRGFFRRPKPTEGY